MFETGFVKRRKEISTNIQKIVNGSSLSKAVLTSKQHDGGNKENYTKALHIKCNGNKIFLFLTITRNLID